jgi:hypothetical protein
MKSPERIGRQLFARSKSPASLDGERALQRPAHEEISGSHIYLAVLFRVESQPI